MGHGGDTITKRKQITTIAIAFKNRGFLIAQNVVLAAIALCVIFSFMPMASAAENLNMAVNTEKLTNTFSNGLIVGNTMLSNEEKAKLQKKIKDKNLTDDNSLKLGSTGEKVKKLQKWLKENEFYNGEIDGNFGNDTETAVKAFQKEVGLKEDGQVGDYTLLAMEQWDEYAAAISNNSGTTSSSRNSEKVYSSASKSKSYQSKKAKSSRKTYSSSRYRGYTNGMDCWAMSSYLSSKLKNQGYTVRTIQYGTSMSSRHRSVQYYSNGAWVNYNYKANGYSSIYYATGNSKNGKVVG